MPTDKWITGLRRLTGKRQLIEVDCGPKIKERVRGYVVGISNSFLMLHDLADSVYLNGYTVLPLKYIRRYRILKDWDQFADRALAARNQMPILQPRINLDNFPKLLGSANGLFPLISIHRELMDDTVCYIGQVADTTDKTFTLRQIDPAAQFDRSRHYRFSDITKIDFGGCYESALWLVYCSETGDEKLLRQAKRLDRPFARRGH